MILEIATSCTLACRYYHSALILAKTLLEHDFERLPTIRRGRCDSSPPILIRAGCPPGRGDFMCSFLLFFNCHMESPK
jgi:hypothetical protein